MSPVGFEPTISAGERPQTHALDRAATGTGTVLIGSYFKISDVLPVLSKGRQGKQRQLSRFETLYTVGLACTVASRFHNAKRDSLYVIRITTRRGLVSVRLLFLIVCDGWPLEPSILSLTRSDITNACAPASAIVNVCTCSYQ